MNYYIDILDTDNDDLTMELESAAKDSIVLDYAGKDEKDELQIVGSSLDFTLEVLWSENTDFFYGDLFTGDEQRYKVELRRESDDLLIWQGFLLPDSYDEPYESGTYYVGFRATDGLGRLKGKKLSDEYYTTEKTVIDIVSECLRLTGLEMPIVFAPGVDNKLNKNWHEIYLHGSNFLDKEKKDDAYKILEYIVHDTVSCVYQHLGKWYVEGLNKRELGSYAAKTYDFEGTYISDATITKVVKNIIGSALANPSITMVAPYNNITVTHEVTPLAFPETIFEESNDGWVKAAGVVEEIFATDWYGSTNFYAKASAPDYNLYLKGSGTAGLISTNFTSLLKKIYIKKNAKIRLKFEFEIDYYLTENSADIDYIISQGRWNNPLRYTIKLGNTTIYTNNGATVSTTEAIIFDTDKEAALNFEFIASNAGLLDVVFFQPYGTLQDSHIKGIFIKEMSLEQIGFEENLTYSDVINEDYTIEKEIELDFADDATGLGKVFRLAQIEKFNATLYNKIFIPITDAFTQNGNHYSVVSLEGANLISDNINSVTRDEAGDEFPVDVLEVIYNLNFGEQMVIVTDVPYTTGNFIVYRYKPVDYDLSRTHWEEWTDSVYNVERKRFPEAVMSVYRRLFKEPQPKIDITANRIPVMFHDLVRWNYIEEANYTPSNLKINFDSGDSTLTLNKASYQVEGSLIPPFVDAGPDIYINSTQTSTFLNATAFDPDGTIVSYLWEMLTGTTGTILQPNSEDTNLFGLNDDDYEFQITVTDNDGLTASDTARVIRIRDFTVSLLELTNVLSDTSTEDSWVKTFRLVVTPAIPDNVTINFTLSFELNAQISAAFSELNNSIARYSITKNGAVLETLEIEANDTQNPTFVFNYITGDVIEFEIYAYTIGLGLGDNTALAQLQLSFGTLVDYPGVILGLPIIETVEVTL